MALPRPFPMTRSGWKTISLENSVIWLVVFLALALAGLGGLSLYGWLRRKEKPPPGVKPLRDEEDW
jgi:uncharacterized membrane protein YphA (DoxX/SURF4 family)